MRLLQPFSGAMIFLLFVFFTLLTDGAIVWARAGGGGSGGGGGGGSGGHGGSGGIYKIIIYLIIAAFIYGGKYLANRKKRIKAALDLQAAVRLDATWDPETLKTRVTEVFFRFQTAWSNLDAVAMKPLLSAEYYKRMVLELSVLQQEHRRNYVKDPTIIAIDFWSVTDQADNSKDAFKVSLCARASDELVDIDTNHILHTDKSVFTEYWHFIRVGDQWLLSNIEQSTADAARLDPAIAAFAKNAGFYFDPDFGWLMLPNKGVLFGKRAFGVSDVNNHVIGYYRKAIVEFYSFCPNPRRRNNLWSTDYVVAQAILPISYKNILIKKRGRWFNWHPRGLRRVTLESVDFDKKFALWASPEDQVNSLELLTPDFMELIYQLPYQLDIEIVGNFLYFYTKNRPASAKQYQEMLTILSQAFDAMRM